MARAAKQATSAAVMGATREARDRPGSRVRDADRGPGRGPRAEWPEPRWPYMMSMPPGVVFVECAYEVSCRARAVDCATPRCGDSPRRSRDRIWFPRSHVCGQTSDSAVGTIADLRRAAAHRLGGPARHPRVPHIDGIP